MGKDEQKEEREVLESIFPDEIQNISDTEFRITVALEPTKESGDDSEDPTIILNVRYPDAYPDEPPLLDITQPPDAPRYSYLDVHEDKARLLESMQATIDESLGMAMVFALVSTLKDSAELLISERQQVLQTQRESEARRAEEEENRKFEGERVTRDSFLAWREKFQKEMADQTARQLAEQEAEEKKKRGSKVEDRKLTGRQLWEQGLAGKSIEEDEDEEDAVAGIKQLGIED